MTPALTTKEGTTVRVGQHWRDLDRRMKHRVREIVAISEAGGKVQMADPNTVGSFSSWVSVRRMHKHSTGWELVKDVKP